MLELYRHYGSLQAVRQGWHCSPELADIHRLAWRFGGPLACVSALALHDAISQRIPVTASAIPEPLHVVVAANTPRVPSPDLLARRWGIPVSESPVVHWSTAHHTSGDRRAVSRDVALWQADRCPEA
jgi:hypothetical protein